MNQKTETTKRRGAVIPSTGKTRVTMFLDDDVIEHFREIATNQGRGYQTAINAALRSLMQAGSEVSLDRGVRFHDIYSQVQSLVKTVGHIESVVVEGFKDLPIVMIEASPKEKATRRYGGGEGKVVLKKIKRPRVTARAP